MKKLHFREMPPEVRDAVDKVQRGDFTSLLLTGSGISVDNPKYGDTEGSQVAGMFNARNDSFIGFEDTTALQPPEDPTGTDSEFLHAHLRGTRFMKFAKDLNALSSANQDQIIFNDGAADIDFIVKGDEDANLITTRASTDKVGIGVAVPRAKLEVHMDNSDTWSSSRTYGNYHLLIKNNNDTVDAFAGIAFDVSSETNLDAIGAAIVAINRDSTAADHHTDLVFATNPDSNDDLTERMRISEIGHVGIGVGAPDMGTTADAGLHIKATSGGTMGNLVVQCTEAGIDQYQSLVNLRWTGDDNIGTENYWVKFVRKSTSGSGQVQVGSINSEVTYSPFTGQHNTLVPAGLLRLGMILKSTGEVFYRKNIDNAWVITETTTVEKDKAVAGVYAGLAIAAEESVVGKQLAGYNAVGEGSILVTDAGGNIETGDYICSSNNLGHGMKQDDDLLHNYTVAKANEPIDFSTVEVDPELGFKSVLVACTYHCG